MKKEGGTSMKPPSFKTPLKKLSETKSLRKNDNEKRNTNNNN